MMENNAELIAKELTLALIPRAGSITNAEGWGNFAGTVFKTVLKQVVEGINDNKPDVKPSLPSSRSNR